MCLSVNIPATSSISQLLGPVLLILCDPWFWYHYSASCPDFLLHTHTICSFFLFSFFFVFSWPQGMACGMLVPWPRIEPISLTLEAQSLNHWTTREVPVLPVEWLCIPRFSVFSHHLNLPGVWLGLPRVPPARASSLSQPDPPTALPWSLEHALTPAFPHTHLQNQEGMHAASSSSSLAPASCLWNPSLLHGPWLQQVTLVQRTGSHHVIAAESQAHPC